MRNAILTLGLVLCLGRATAAFGWGQYGHEQINSAAIDLLNTNTSLGQCFRNARKMVIRYAITPDMEWKTDLFLKYLKADLSKKRRDDDCYEHPLHFFEADAFAGDTKAILKLPIDGDYTQAFKKYSKLMSQNMKTVQEVDPTKKISDPAHPSPADVMDHGTALWRARQLYVAGVTAMKAKKFQLAALYLSTMGHYIGDMSQPYHATMNFDGDYPQQEMHAGIHHEIDTGLFGRFNPSKDQSGVFVSFENTNAAVTATAKTELEKYPQNFGAEDIVPSMLKIVDSGYPLAESLLKIYAGLCNDANSGIAKKKPRHSRKVASDDKAPYLNAHYCSTISDKPGHKTPVRAIGTAKEDQFSAAKIDGKPVIDILDERLGTSAALLAKFWESAYREAGEPALGSCTGAAWTFNQGYAISNYPIPDYYPAGYSGRAKNCPK